MISVIIPVYNTAKFLDKCLFSLKTQIFTDFEVIIVDDGSTDNSAEICKKYAENDSRFKYYYKDNGGAASARNYGIEKASGDYISFIDSDDFVDEDYLAVLTAPLSKASCTIVQCGMKLIRGSDITELVPDSCVFECRDYIKAILSRKIQIFLFQTPTSKLYNRSFINDKNLRFDENTTISEDCLFNTFLMNAEPQKIYMINYAGYNYLQDNSYLTKSKRTFERVYQSLQVGIITSAIRNSLIEKYGFSDESDVVRGFHTAICIIYISNAREIETNGFSKEEKAKLYDSYFSIMNYPVDKSIEDYSGTDRKIIEFSVNKDGKSIGKIYKMRDIKSKLKSKFR